MAFMAACGATAPVTDSVGLRATSSQQLYEFMLDQSVAHKRAREIASACSWLQLDRRAVARRNAVLSDEVDRLEIENPAVFQEFAERMGFANYDQTDAASRGGNRRPTVLEMTQLNDGMLLDFGSSVLLRLAVSRSSDSCADGAREMDGGTLVGSFLKPVG